MSTFRRSGSAQAILARTCTRQRCGARVTRGSVESSAERKCGGGGLNDKDKHLLARSRDNFRHLERFLPHESAMCFAFAQNRNALISDAHSSPHAIAIAIRSIALLDHLPEEICIGLNREKERKQNVSRSRGKPVAPAPSRSGTILGRDKLEKASQANWLVRYCNFQHDRRRRSEHLQKFTISCGATSYSPRDR